MQVTIDESTLLLVFIALEFLTVVFLEELLREVRKIKSRR
jgi:hypothetical protein